MSSRAPIPRASRPPPCASWHHETSPSASGILAAANIRSTNVSAKRGLVPAVCLTYPAPGGDYAALHLVLLPGCPNDTLDYTESVRKFVSSLQPRSFDLVEPFCVGFLTACGCAPYTPFSPGCRIDSASTIGFYIRFHSPEGDLQSFSHTTQDSSWTMSSGSTISPLASDPMIISSSWPSLPPS